MRKMLIAALAGALVALAVGVFSGARASGIGDGTTTETVEAPAAGLDISGPGSMNSRKNSGSVGVRKVDSASTVRD